METRVVVEPWALEALRPLTMLGRRTVNERESVDQLEPSDVADRIDELLELAYRSSSLRATKDPIDEAIRILLGFQTREAFSIQIYERLIDRYPEGWCEILEASEQDLTEVLRPVGYGTDRILKLKSFLSAVVKENGAQNSEGPLSLEFLNRMTEKDALGFLESIYGIGPKTARRIMADSLGNEPLAVDMHGRRILRRLGLIKRSTNELCHNHLESLVPNKTRKRLCINLIHHGRTVCRSQRPRCHDCILVSFCSKGQREVATGKLGPVTVELFAGAGGLGSGFRHAGYRIAVAVERDRNPAQTYRFNHPGTPVIEADVCELNEKDLRVFVPYMKSVSVLLAGPPCQGYSVAGKRDPKAPINLLYKEVARFARLIQPEIVVVENVLGLRGVNGVGFIERIREEIQSAGYWVGAPVRLEAARFGVSQKRSRLIYLARRVDLGEAPTAPDPTHLPADEDYALENLDLPRTPKLEDILGDLPNFGPGIELEYGLVQGRYLYNASTMAHSKRVVDKISKIAPGKGPISYRRLDRCIARTLVAGHRALPVHPWLDRTISVREAARIQGFSDSYVFSGPRSSQPLQVANAVPPPLAEAIARHLVGFLSQ